MTDIEIANKIQNNPDSCVTVLLEELKKRHSGIYHNHVISYSGINANLKQDYEDNKNFIFWKAANTFREDKYTSFAYHLSLTAKYDILTYLKKEYKHSKDRVQVEENMDQTIEEQIEKYNLSLNPEKGTESIDKVDLYKFALKHVKKKYSERDFLIFVLRIKKAMNWRQISQYIKNRGTPISHQGCLNIFERIIFDIRQELKNEFSFKF